MSYDFEMVEEDGSFGSTWVLGWIDGSELDDRSADYGFVPVRRAILTASALEALHYAWKFVPEERPAPEGTGR